MKPTPSPSRLRLAFLVLASGVLLGCGPLTAKDYFVSVYTFAAGDGSMDRPWRTVELAAAQELQPGDRVIFRRGTYFPEDALWLRYRGTEEKPVVWMAYPGEDVVIDFAGVKSPKSSWWPGYQLQAPAGAWNPVHRTAEDGPVAHGLGALQIFEAQYFILDGITVRNSPGVGIHLGNSKDIVIRFCRTEGTVGSGMSAWDSERVVFEGCEIVDMNRGMYNEALTISRSMEFLVRGSWIHHGLDGRRGGEGLDVKESSRWGRIVGNHIESMRDRPGLYVDAWMQTLEDVEYGHNVVHGAVVGLGLATEMGGVLRRFHAHNNVLFSNTLGGIMITAWGGNGDQPKEDILIENNTVVGNGFDWPGRRAGGFRNESTKLKRVTVRNNLFAANFPEQYQNHGDESGMTLIDNVLQDSVAGFLPLGLFWLQEPGKVGARHSLNREGAHGPVRVTEDLGVRQLEFWTRFNADHVVEESTDAGKTWKPVEYAPGRGFRQAFRRIKVPATPKAQYRVSYRGPYLQLDEKSIELRHPGQYFLNRDWSRPSTADWPAAGK